MAWTHHIIAAIWIANVLGWPIIHLAISAIVLRIPLHRFANDNFLFKSRAWEKSEAFYRNTLAVHRWKSILPDGAPWLGGFSKRSLASRDPAYIHTFLMETRRAELAHWYTLLCLPIFFLWNPLWACLAMTIYAMVANLPCILAQRYNRIVLERLFEKMESRCRAKGLRRAR